ncbi:hypothetical protein KKG41_02020 [Patescibacteria group bacterium]|nr:hypothetical protein [Patescibacteria group bacterium]MBU1890243.1 hypothetical protein [Patescibacteria group bacterium]
MKNILVFGDSGSYGAWDINGGWVQRLRQSLDKENIKNLKNFTLVYNSSISGNTTKDVLDRFNTETKAYLNESKVCTIIFSIGINDSRKINNEHAVSPDEFKKNVIELINRAKKHTPIIVFVGPVPIHPIFVQWSKTETYDIKDIQNYGNIVKSACETNNVHFIELFDELLKIDHKELLQDELHYNTEGHKKIYELVKDFLVTNNIVL